MSWSCILEEELIELKGWFGYQGMSEWTSERQGETRNDPRESKENLAVWMEYGKSRGGCL